MTNTGRTKKYMVEDYERLYAHAELLELYLYDTQHNVEPDGVDKIRDEHDKVIGKASLYRATGAAGGYVVVLNGNTNVYRLDDIRQRYSDDHSVYTLGLRIALERLTQLRNKLYENLGCGVAE